MIGKLPQYWQHWGSVRRIKFNWRFSENQNENGTKSYQIATCANDHSVRIFKLNMLLD